MDTVSSSAFISMAEASTAALPASMMLAALTDISAALRTMVSVASSTSTSMVSSPSKV